MYMLTSTVHPEIIYTDIGRSRRKNNRLQDEPLDEFDAYELIHLMPERIKFIPSHVQQTFWRNTLSLQ